MTAPIPNRNIVRGTLDPTYFTSPPAVSTTLRPTSLDGTIASSPSGAQPGAVLTGSVNRAWRGNAQGLRGLIIRYHAGLPSAFTGVQLPGQNPEYVVRFFRRA